MKSAIKILVLGSLPLLLFACGDNSSSDNGNSSRECDQYTRQPDREACQETQGFLPTQVRETPRPG